MPFRVTFDRYPAEDWIGECETCKIEFDGESPSLIRKAIRKHVRETGHSVHLIGTAREDYWALDEDGVAVE